MLWIINKLIKSSPWKKLIGEINKNINKIKHNKDLQIDIKKYTRIKLIVEEFKETKSLVKLEYKNKLKSL